MKRFTSEKQKTGEIGEEIAIRFLKKHSYDVLDKNYTRKWGEIDIVAKKKDILHFVEVKTVTDKDLSKFSRGTFSRETSDNKDYYRPEENVHPWKLKRIHRTIETYMADKGFSGDWQLDLVLIYLDLEANRSGVRFLENIV